jgi:hypothetical protein
MSNPHIHTLIGMILQKRIEIVERVNRPAQFGEPYMQKHIELMALHSEARVYAAELAKIIGEEATKEQWELLGRLAHNLVS